jgi:hypothetical protein
MQWKHYLTFSDVIFFFMCFFLSFLVSHRLAWWLGQGTTPPWVVAASHLNEGLFSEVDRDVEDGTAI